MIVLAFSVQNFTQLGGSADFYVLLFGVVYLSCCDFAMHPAKEQHTILCKCWKKCDRPLQWLEKRSGMKAWALYECVWLACSVQGRQKKATQVNSILITFFDISVIVHKEFVLAGQTVYSTFYVLRRLRENARRLRPELWRQRSWLLHHDNAPSHISLFTREFSAQNSMALGPHQPYFSLFPHWRASIAESLAVLSTRREHDFQDGFNNGRSAGNGAYALKGSTSRVMVDSRPQVSFWPDGISPGNYGWWLCIHGFRYTQTACKIHTDSPNWYSDGLRAGRPRFNSRQCKILLFFHTVQTNSGTHSASYRTGNGPGGGKAAGGWRYHPHLVPW
jgi:hypothetical protein